MDDDRDPEPPRPETPRAEPRPRPAEADVLPTAEPDDEFVAAYAAWRIDRPEDPR